jgi:hypothetical protein
MKQDRAIYHCNPLIGCLLNSIRTRFDHLFIDKHLRLASLSDPHFKLSWVRDSETKIGDVALLRNEVLRRKSAAVESQSVKLF